MNNSNKIYDLVVIGAGSGGVRAARISASYGAKVVVIDFKKCFTTKFQLQLEWCLNPNEQQ